MLKRNEQEVQALSPGQESPSAEVQVLSTGQETRMEYQSPGMVLVAPKLPSVLSLNIAFAHNGQLCYEAFWTPLYTCIIHLQAMKSMT